MNDDERSVLYEIKEDIGKILEKSISNEQSIQKVEKILLGNGQKGLLERVANLEQNLVTRTEVLGKIDDLKNSVDRHHSDTEAHTPKMFLKKEYFVYIGMAFIIFHTLLENGGPVVEFLLKFLNLK